MIHVEHDMVATHVVRYQHEQSYNHDLPQDDGIDHVYVSKFEEIWDNLDGFMAKHGRKCILPFTSLFDCGV